jgi:hypothetical protein
VACREADVPGAHARHLKLAEAAPNRRQCCGGRDGSQERREDDDEERHAAQLAGKGTGDFL